MEPRRSPHDSGSGPGCKRDAPASALPPRLQHIAAGRGNEGEGGCPVKSCHTRGPRDDRRRVNRSRKPGSRPSEPDPLPGADVPAMQADRPPGAVGELPEDLLGIAVAGTLAEPQRQPPVDDVPPAVRLQSATADPGAVRPAVVVNESGRRDRAISRRQTEGGSNRGVRPRADGRLARHDRRNADVDAKCDAQTGAGTACHY